MNITHNPTRYTTAERHARKLKATRNAADRLPQRMVTAEAQVAKETAHLININLEPTSDV